MKNCESDCPTLEMSQLSLFVLLNMKEGVGRRRRKDLKRREILY